LLTPTIFQLSLKKQDSSDAFDFNAGQYAVLSFFRKGRPTPARCFSISSAPSEAGTFEFAMRIKGRFTAALSKIKTGDIVRVDGPFGAFVLDRYKDRQTTFIAGGIGITPFMSMLKEAAHTGSAQKATLIYSVQTQEEVAFREELKQIVENNKNIRVIVVVNKGSVEQLNGLEVVSGRVDENVFNKLSNDQFAKDSFFMCGPPGFMKVMRLALKSRGVDDYRIITEAFSQGSKNQSEKLLSWPANMYALTALSLVVVMTVIMVRDILASLPKSVNSSSSTGGYTTKQQVDQAVSTTPPQVTTTQPATTPTTTTKVTSTPKTVPVSQPRTKVS
jgi:ferredoxin-NADP reductase